MKSEKYSLRTSESEEEPEPQFFPSILPLFFYFYESFFDLLFRILVLSVLAPFFLFDAPFRATVDFGSFDSFTWMRGRIVSGVYRFSLFFPRKFYFEFYLSECDSLTHLAISLFISCPISRRQMCFNPGGDEDA